MNKWINRMLSSEGDISSKRVITFIAFILLALGFIANLFFKLTVVEFMYDTMSYIVIAGLGFTASEFFSGRGKNSNKDSDTPVE